MTHERAHGAHGPPGLRAPPPPPPPVRLPSAHLYRVDDINFSDADTLPEFSNRDGSKETTTDPKSQWQLTLIRVPGDVDAGSLLKTCAEAVVAEMRATWKSPTTTTTFAFFSPPHIPILHVAHGIAKSFGERTVLRSSYYFCEPKNDKLPIARDSDIKNLKFEVILGASRFNWLKPETPTETAKRIESSVIEVLRVIPNVVLFLGPIAFDGLYETLEKQKPKRSLLRTGAVVVENFRRTGNEWKRIPKVGTSLTLAPTKGF